MNANTQAEYRFRIMKNLSEIVLCLDECDENTRRATLEKLRLLTQAYDLQETGEKLRAEEKE